MDDETSIAAIKALKALYATGFFIPMSGLKPKTTCWS